LLKLSAGVVFLQKMDTLYPRLKHEGNFLWQRPDFFLGQFLRMFHEDVFALDFDTAVVLEPLIQREKLLEMIASYFNGFQFGEAFIPGVDDLPGCRDAAQGLYESAF
jgi:hypothetical protein